MIEIIKRQTDMLIVKPPILIRLKTLFFNRFLMASFMEFICIMPGSGVMISDK